MKKRGSRSASSSARRTAPFEPCSPGDSTIVAPYSCKSRRRSSVALAGSTQVSRYPLSFATSASAMPVLPDVGSRSSRPGSSSPTASAAPIIARATRSLIEPVGFWPSSFAYSRTDGFGARRGSSTSGVLPTSSRREPAVWGLEPTGHRGEQDDRGTVVDRRVEPVERPNVLSLDVDVHERRDVVVLDELRPQPREAGHEIVEQLAHGVAVGGHLARAADLTAQHGRNPDQAHACAGLPEQNST